MFNWTFPLIILNSFATTVYAKEPLICQDPAKAICSSGVKDSKETLQPIADWITEHAAAQVNTFLKQKLPVDSYGPDLEEQLKTYPLEHGLKKSTKLILRAILYTSCTDFLARAYYSGNHNNLPCFKAPPSKRSPLLSLDSISSFLMDQKHFDPVNSTIATAKKFVSMAIQNASLSAKLKSLLQARLDSTEHGNLVDSVLQGIKGLDEDDVKEPDVLLDVVQSDCSFDLTDANAFNAVLNSHNVLVACPSLWVFGMRDENHADSSLPLDTLMHELGHTVEGLIFTLKTPGPVNPEITQESSDRYKRVISCMDDRYIHTHLLSAKVEKFPSPEVETEFMNEMDFDPNEVAAQLFYREYSADVISSTALALYLAQAQPAIDVVDLITQSLKDYCVKESDNVDDPIQQPKFKNVTLHPAGKFRIENDYLSNEDLRLQLSCAPRGENNVCTLL